ncbi:MAG TPA: hypothetical protein PLE35_10160, partial [Lentisphaeria bacterium]|nr:hypothetical protein [Lentisphaeria bacterium]
IGGLFRGLIGRQKRPVRLPRSCRQHAVIRQIKLQHIAISHSYVIVFRSQIISQQILLGVAHVNWHDF